MPKNILTSGPDEADSSMTTPVTSASVSKLTDNLALAKAEAYQGEVSVEDAGPDPAPSGDLEQRVTAVETGKADRTEVQAVWDQMAAAYQEGVQNA